MAAQAQTQHEGGDDHRDRIKADPGLQGEDALPGDLVGQRGRTAEEKGDTDDEETRIRRRHESPILALHDKLTLMP